MSKVWLRLGGSIQTTSTEQLEAIKRGDVNALLQALKDNGFEVDGNSYIPERQLDGDGDVEFELPFMKLTFFR